MQRIWPKLFLLTGFLFFQWMILQAQEKAAGQQLPQDRLLPADMKKVVSEIRSIDPADTDFADLKGLKKAIGGAQIVLLGEQTHGEGSTFLAKTRIIKFLREKMGFEVLAFESGLYDCARIWENVQNGGRLSDEVIGSLFYMYATSRQMQPLFDYIQSGISPGPTTGSGARSLPSLILAGFESQHTGVKAKTELFADFGRFLQGRDPEMLDSSWRLFQRVSIATFNSRGYRPAEGERNVFFREISALKEVLSGGNPVAKAKSTHGKEVMDSLTGSAGFWYQVVGSIESQALRYWQLTKGNEVSVRDLQMAKNLIWLAEKAYPGKKIIVWAHNVHIARSLVGLGPDTAESPAPAAGKPAAPAPDNPDAFAPMGATIHAHFGSRAYHIGFSGTEGTYMDFGDSHIVSVTARPGNSIEGALAATGYAYSFIDYRHAPAVLRQKQVASLADYGELKGAWPDVFDGLVVVKKIFPVERTGK